MATQGSIYITITTNSQNVSGNYSNVTAKVYYYGNGESWSGYSRPGTLVLNGTTYSFSHTFDTTIAAQELYSVTTNIAHNTDGTKVLNASATFATGSSYLGTLTASLSKTLTPIARLSTFSINTYNLSFGDTLIFTISSATDSYYNVIQAGVPGTLSYTDIGIPAFRTSSLSATKNWIIPKDWAQYMPAGQKIRPRLLTYSDANLTNLVGSYYISSDITVNPTSDMKPNVTVSYTYNTASKYGGYVKDQSRVTATVTETFYKGTTASSRSLTIGGQNVALSTTYNSSTGVYTSTGTTASPIATNSAVYTVRDGRGAETTDTITLSPFRDWSNPQLTNIQVGRSRQNGSSYVYDEEGTYITVSGKVSISPLNNQNGKSFVITYTNDAGTSTGSSGNIYSGTAAATYIIDPVSYTFAANANDNYTVTLTASDDFSTTTLTYKVGAAFILIDFNKTGRGITFGAPATVDGINITMDTNISSNLTTTGNIYTVGSSSSSKLKLGPISDGAIQNWRARTEESSGNLSLDGILTALANDTLLYTSGLWKYRTINSMVEMWYHGSITFSEGSSAVGGWQRAEQSIGLPIAVASDAVVLVSGSYVGRIYSSAGAVTNSGTTIAVQIYGVNAINAGTYNNFSIYVAGKRR